MTYGYTYLTCFIVSIILIIKILKYKKSELGVFLILIAAMNGFWLLMVGAAFFTDDVQLIIGFQMAKYFAIIFISPTMLLMSYVFTYGRDKLSRMKVLLIYVVPLLSCMSILFNREPYPFIYKPTIEFQESIPIFMKERQIGFYVHTYYSYLTVLLSNGLLFVRAINLPKFYRRQSWFIFIGSMISVILNVGNITGTIGGEGFDSTPVSILFTLIVFYWGLYVIPANKLTNRARNLVIENMGDMVIILDIKRNIIDYNKAAKDFFLELYHEIHDEKAAPFRIGTPYEKALKAFGFNESTYESLAIRGDKDLTLHLDGQAHYFELQYQSIIDSDGSTIGELCLFKNVTNLQNYVNQLLDANEELDVSHKVIMNAREAILITNADNKMVKVNQSMVNMTGYSIEELLGEDPRILKSDHHDYIFYRDMWDEILENGFWEGEIWDRRKNGEIYPKWMSITVIKNNQGEITRYIGISSDVSKIKKAEEDIHRMAYFDLLTELPNRSLFHDRLSTAIRRAKRRQKYFSLMFIDLDRFKEINDTYGHSVGDQLLILVSKRIKTRVRASDTLSRLGGDEFTLILEDLNTPAESECVASQILDELRRPFLINNSEIHVMVSIGIVIGRGEETNNEVILKHADIAMYHAKEIGGNQYFVSSEEIEQKKEKEHLMSIALKDAVKEEAFELYLQPQIVRSSHGLEICGAEALIRWPQRDGSMISPLAFIEIAEKNGCIHQMGIWVVKEVLRLNQKLRQQGIHINLSLNVSVQQFEQRDFVEKVSSILESEDLGGHPLTFEITESLFFRDLEKGIYNMESLKSLGIKIALDDFGTGFSSLSYLDRLPIDYLKIDKSFIDKFNGESGKSLALMILSMAQSLKVKTVAEGVESEEQYKELFEAGCDIIQGYHFSRPLPYEEFVSYVRAFDGNEEIILAKESYS